MAEDTVAGTNLRRKVDKEIIDGQRLFIRYTRHSLSTPQL